jgi:predicted small secreted protein
MEFVMKRARTLRFLVALGLGSTAACALPDGAGDDINAESSVQAQSRIVGTWKSAIANDGQPTAPRIVQLGFTAQKSAKGFKLEVVVDSGFRLLCQPGGPCPSSEKSATGEYTLSADAVMLTFPKGSGAAAFAGKYTVKFAGDDVVLSRAGKSESYKRTGGDSFCKDGTVAEEVVYSDSLDDKTCAVKKSHCLSKSQCIQKSPPGPGFCTPGTHLVIGPTTYSTLPNGKECSDASFHCVTDDAQSCPQLLPQPPDFCKDGVIAQRPRSFTASADGAECELPRVTCLTKNKAACVK